MHYKHAVERKDLDRDAKKAAMRENGELRLREIKEFKDRQMQKMAQKREEQAKYRDVLDIQVTSLK